MSSSSYYKPSTVREGDPLTRRELQILALATAGENTPAISKRLGIAQNTVKTHLTSVYRKTGSRNRVEAAGHYLDQFAVAPSRDPGSEPAAGRGAIPLIRQQIRALQDRLDELAPAVSEAERRRETLEALRRIKLD